MNERGFTLIELLVGITVSLVVFGLVGTSLVGYGRNAAASMQQNDSQDGARLAMDRIVRELRDIASSRTSPTLIESAGSYDLVFQTVGAAPAAGSQNPTGRVRMRYCIPPSDEKALIMQTESWTTAAAPANPWPITGGASTACPSTPASLPAGASIATTRLAEDVTNRFAGAARPAFTYDSTSLSQITTVGVDLFVDVNTAQDPEETELHGAAFLRNQNQVPVVSFTANATGAGHLLLNGGLSSDPDNQELSFKWFNVVAGNATEIGATGLLDWAPGAGTYDVRLQVTDTGGLTATETRTVVVS